VHVVRTFDRHSPVCSKVDQSETIFICTLMQAVKVICWCMYVDERVAEKISILITQRRVKF
jgi:hypothetical protein